MAKTPSRSPKEYEQIGRMVEHVYEYNYANRWRAYQMSFFKGVIAGFGGVIGATVVVGMLLWVLSLLHYVPFVNRITDNFQRSVESSETK